MQHPDFRPKTAAPPIVDHTITASINTIFVDCLGTMAKSICTEINDSSPPLD